ncbi:hypothetical protein ACPCSC_30270 [Streptomyces lavendulocolor]|uniref:hypothetical protein n=1 Tax=Streptomyces lavendulocolor TaxID=67316 RepID=UPI003C2F5F4D
MSGVNPREVIAQSLGNMVDFGRSYGRALPDELARWHCYTRDGGHSILVVLDDGTLGDAPSRQKITDQLVPAPVKAVERADWRTLDGFVVCTLPYDPELGLVTDPDDDEHGDGSAAEPALTKYAVGEPYPGNVRWRDGACEIRITEHGVDFVLAFANPKTHEVKAFRKGNAEFALTPGKHHLIWSYRFTDAQDSNPKHGIPWSDQPWEYHRQAAVELPAAPGPRGASFPLQLILVDSATGIVQGLRLIGPTVEFADALRDAVEAQARVPHDPAAAQQEMESVFARYPSSTDLLLAAEARFEALRDDTVR